MFVRSIDRSASVSDSSGVSWRVANVGQIDRMLGNAFYRVNTVSRRRGTHGLGPGGRPGREHQRVVDGRFGIATFDLVLAFLQHRRLQTTIERLIEFF